MDHGIGFDERDERIQTSAFLQGMDRLDRRLVAERIPAAGRPIEALRRIAIARREEINMGGSAQLSTAEAAFEWYDERYGDRLNIDFSPGRAVIVVRGDPLIMRLPFIVGRWDGIADVTKLLPSLTQPMFASLSEGEMQDIVAALPWMQQRFAVIEGLPEAIRANLNAAIMQMTAHAPHFGESRWASLQFAEKTLKHLLRAKGRTPSRTHDLVALLKHCEEAGLPRGMRPLLAMVQCDPGVRYAEDSTLEAALAAHHASIDLAAHAAHHLGGGDPPGPIVDQRDLADLVLSMSFGIEVSYGGHLLFVLAMGDGQFRRLLLSGAHAEWLHEQLAASRARGRHTDERVAFANGRDLRNAPPRHPLRLMEAHLPAFGPADYNAENIMQAEPSEPTMTTRTWYWRST